MLADWSQELAKLQAIMNQLRSARREMDAESFRSNWSMEDFKRRC